MTEQSDPSALEREDQPRGSAPVQEESQEPGAADQEGSRLAGTEGLRSLESLERLRDRVEVAAREMRRLREENGALARRIQELESRPAVDPGQTVISLDHDPDLLKRKIAGFIEAIDRYLEKEQRPS